MSDDLVKRLRDWERVWPEDMDKPAGHLYEQAADRIEELEAKLSDAQYEIDFLNAQLEAWQEMAPPATKGLLKKHMKKLVAEGKLTGGQNDQT